MEAQLERPHNGATVPPYEAWPSVPKGPLGLSAEVANSTGMDVDSVASPDTVDGRATSILSMDDLEAAQALEGLRTDFMNSPARQPAPLPTKSDTPSRDQNNTQEPEPLLALLTSTHPILSTAINGSLSAYSSSKTYSPRFRYGAEFVERHIGNPVASTVGTAGRISGVETGVRWWLQRTDSHGQEDGSNKRRKVGNNDSDARKETDIEKGLQDVELRPQLQSPQHRRSSEMSCAESLPAYDDHRSPTYEEQNTMSQYQSRRSQSPQGHGQTWQTRLMMSTSGLGVAMSEESLRSLKYCLNWLRWANEHLGKAIVSLKNVLEEWSRSQQQQQQQQQQQMDSARSDDDDDDTTMTGQDDPQTQQPNTEPGSRPPRDQATISSHLTALKTDILATLKKVVDVVSTYAGGALPDNARVLVRRHLTSLPQRFRLASTSSSSSSSSSSTSSTRSGNGDDSERQSQSETVAGAKRVLVLAMEGLDMLGQVAGVVDGTIGSAEEWCERLGRRGGGGGGGGRGREEGGRGGEDMVGGGMGNAVGGGGGGGGRAGNHGGGGVRNGVGEEKEKMDGLMRGEKNDVLMGGEKNEKEKEMEKSGWGEDRKRG